VSKATFVAIVKSKLMNYVQHSEPIKNLGIPTTQNGHTCHFWGNDKQNHCYAYTAHYCDYVAKARRTIAASFDTALTA